MDKRLPVCTQVQRQKPSPRLTKGLLLAIITFISGIKLRIRQMDSEEKYLIRDIWYAVDREEHNRAKDKLAYHKLKSKFTIHLASHFTICLKFSSVQNLDRRGTWPTIQQKSLMNLFLCLKKNGGKVNKPGRQKIKRQTSWQVREHAWLHSDLFRI